MYLIIVGAEPEGLSLVGLALKDGHRVTLIEAEASRAEAGLQQYDVTVLPASIAEGGILDEVDTVLASLGSRQLRYRSSRKTSETAGLRVMPCLPLH